MLVTFPERDLCVDLQAIKRYSIHRLEKPEYSHEGDPTRCRSHFVTANGNIGDCLKDQVTLYNGMKQECRDFIHDIKLLTVYNVLQEAYRGDYDSMPSLKAIKFIIPYKLPMGITVTNTYGSPMKIKPWLSDHLKVVDEGYVDPKEVFNRFQASEWSVEDIDEGVFHYLAREWRGFALYDRARDGGTYENLEWIKQLDFTEEVKPE